LRRAPNAAITAKGKHAGTVAPASSPATVVAKKK
jgi:hypothetical protein